jgi:hypothetical protein
LKYIEKFGRRESNLSGFARFLAKNASIRCRHAEIRVRPPISGVRHAFLPFRPFANLNGSILLLPSETDMAMVPDQTTDPDWDVVPQKPSRPIAWWVRGILLAIVGVWLAVFCIAVRLNPYQDGRVWFQETHTQLGLPPCSFKTLTGGLPCPSCGMSTSFALLVRGDVVHSVQANFVGSCLAIFGAAFVLWAIASVVRGRLLGVRSVEMTLIRLTIAFVILLFGRWGIVLALHYWGGGT